MLTVELESKPLFATAPADETANTFFTCGHCFQEFKREDHLHRHELSHQEPRYHCSYPACNKAFRRKDVLKRHQLVHKPGPPRRRRWTKDETNKHSPKYKGYGEVREASSTSPICGVSPDNISNTLGFQADETSSPLVKNDFFLDSIEHCFPVTVPRLPFIHLSTMGGGVARELQLAMAIISAHRLDATGARNVCYFSEAYRILQSSPQTATLHRLQAEVLLIEYAAWSGRDSLRLWALQEQLQAMETIRSLLANLQPNLPSRWAKWLYAEELKRTVLAFYCLSVALGIFFGYDTPLSYRDIDLCCPCSDDLWNAPNEIAWGELLLFWSPGDEIPFTIATAVEVIMSRGRDERRPHQPTSMFCRHVLLCALLEEAGLVKALKKTTV